MQETKSNAVYQAMPRIEVKITDHKLKLVVFNQCICSFLFVHNTPLIRFWNIAAGIELLHKSQE